MRFPLGVLCKTRPPAARTTRVTAGRLGPQIFSECLAVIEIMLEWVLTTGVVSSPARVRSMVTAAQVPQTRRRIPAPMCWGSPYSWRPFRQSDLRCFRDLILGATWLTPSRRLGHRGRFSGNLVGPGSSPRPHPACWQGGHPRGKHRFRTRGSQPPCATPGLSPLWERGDRHCGARCD